MKRTFWAILLIVCTSGQATVRTQTRKLIIDADPGIDDAIAIILAMQYRGFQILGITTGFGNASLEHSTKNALRIVELSGKDIPVYRGAEKPRTVPLDAPPDFVHGKDGLGNTDQPEPRQSPAAQSAAGFIVETVNAHPGEITILTIGRHTNLADALDLDPDLAKKVHEVVVMGGALYVPGNVSPVAEANIAGDPHAADLVFSAPWRVTMIGLDVTTKVKLSDDILLRIKNKNTQFGPFIFAITRFYLNFHKNVNHVDGGFYVHDPSAVMYLIDPTLFTVKRGPVRVVTDGIAIGQTIMAAYDYQLQLAPWAGEPAVTAAVDVDAKRFLRTFESVIIRR